MTIGADSVVVGPSPGLMTGNALRSRRPRSGRDSAAGRSRHRRRRLPRCSQLGNAEPLLRHLGRLRGHARARRDLCPIDPPSHERPPCRLATLGVDRAVREVRRGDCGIQLALRCVRRRRRCRAIHAFGKVLAEDLRSGLATRLRSSRGPLAPNSSKSSPEPCTPSWAPAGSAGSWCSPG